MAPSLFNLLKVEGDETARAFVRSVGLSDISELLDFKKFAPFKEKPFTKVYRLESAELNRVCFLKKTPFNKTKSFLRYFLKALIRQQMPHTESFHVYATSQKLRGLQIAAMDVIAYGELRAFGVWPLSGFALCSAVQGQDFSDLFKAGAQPTRLALLDALGWQLAQMHHCGVFYNTRMHDYFVHPDFFDNPRLPEAERLTLIDLDFADSTWSSAMLSVTHSVYLTLRTGIRLSPIEIAQFFRSYRKAMREKGQPVSRKFISGVRELLNKELIAHHANAEQVRLFPQTPKPC